MQPYSHCPVCDIFLHDFDANHLSEKVSNCAAVSCLAGFYQFVSTQYNKLLRVRYIVGKHQVISYASSNTSELLTMNFPPKRVAVIEGFMDSNNIQHFQEELNKYLMLI